MKGLLAAAGIVAFSFLIMLFGYGNAETDAGYGGYVYQGAVFTAYEYSGVQTGKTSTGLEFSPYVINVSTTPYASEERFDSGTDKSGKAYDESVVAKDKLRVEFSAHIFWRVTDVKSFVESWGQIDSGNTPDQVATQTYSNVLRPVVRAYIREEVEAFDGLDLGSHQGDIATKVLARLKDYVKDKKLPIEVTSVNVGTIQPPADVLNAISDTQALSNKPAQLDQEILNHQQQKLARIAEANGIEAGMKALSDKLTPEYLLWEMTKALESMKDAPNHSIIFMPRVPMTGTVPMGGTVPAPEAVPHH